ncbi:hypothetical protein KY321_05390 [Candidatus Woesearchaeota archaeon]|nr:hypothetical protein [Candidatus Woesearchaeota archaeon]
MLEELVKIEYHSKDVSKFCRSEVVSFIESTEDVEGECIFFLKRITKVATNIANSKPQYISHMYERVYSFNRVGYQNLARIKKRSPNEQRMMAHFHSHAASIAKKIYLETSCERWFDIFVNEKLNSIHKSLKQEVKHKAHSYSLIALSCQEYARKSENIHYLEKAKHFYKKAGILFQPIDPSKAFKFRMKARECKYNLKRIVTEQSAYSSN